jgi:integrase
VGIRKRGKFWFVDVRDGAGRRIRKSVGRSKAVAALVEKDLQVKIAKREYLGIFEADSTPFSKYAQDWLERKKMTVTQSTYRDYRSTLSVYAIPHFGATPICQVLPRDAIDFLERLGKLSAKRKNNIMVPVKCLFGDAKRRGDIKENPCDTIRRFKEEKAFIDPLSFPEIKLFLEQVDPHYLSYFTTAFLTGMRPNELLALKWTNVDFSMRLITVREGRVQGIEGPPKTLSSYRDIDILPPLFDLLERHREKASADARHVFLSEKGKPLQVDNLRHRVWYPALERADLRKRTMYQTRHSFASLMLAHGEDPLWVARMLGHTSTEMLYRHYGKYIRNRMRRDGLKFLAGLEEADVPAALVPVAAVSGAAQDKLNAHSGHKMGTLCKFVAKKGATRLRATP